MIRPLPLLALVVTLAGCSRDDTRYPSLAPRAVEKRGFAEPEVAVTVATPDPALDARIARASAELDRIAKGFAGDAAVADAAARAARGRDVGSDAWLTAQTALASLDDWRSQGSALIGDLDQLAIDRQATLAPDYPALATLRQRAQAEADRQAQTIGRIQSSLPAA